jgi:hypothetical protein
MAGGMPVSQLVRSVDVGSLRQRFRTIFHECEPSDGRGAAEPQVMLGPRTASLRSCAPSEGSGLVSCKRYRRRPGYVPQPAAVSARERGGHCN